MNIPGHTDGAALTAAELRKVQVPIHLLKKAEKEEMIAQQKDNEGWDYYLTQLCWLFADVDFMSQFSCSRYDENTYVSTMGWRGAVATP